MTDDDAVKTLLAAMHTDDRITSHNARISVDLEDGALTLYGYAKHIAAKRRAAALAEQHFGRRCRVIDLLRRDVTKALTDVELARTVGERLLEEPVFAEHTIEVDEGDNDNVPYHDAGEGAYVLRVSARDGIVTLSGTVGSQTHRRLAEVIAWWTGAVAAVVNELEIAPPEEDDDNELTDAVRMTLEKDPLVDASQLRVGTAAGIVHVEGLIRNDEQRDAVLEDVWLVPGVVDVVDRLQTMET